MDAEVLIIDDDQELGEMLREFLAPDHFHVSARTSGEEGLAALEKKEYDLVILDIMLPGMSGLDVLRQLRKTSDRPVIMLTARGDDVDRILGLEFGADDYLAKPFNPRELLARIKAIMRRARPAPTTRASLQVGGITIETQSRQVSVDGTAMRLTGTEYELLHCLAAAAGDVISRERLSREVLGRSLLPYDRSIDTHISNVRQKLAKAGVTNPQIQNQRGVGYRMLVAKPEQDA